MENSHCVVESPKHQPASSGASQEKSCVPTGEKKGTTPNHESKPLLSSNRPTQRSCAEMTAAFVVRLAALLLFTGFIISYIALSTPNFVQIDIAENKNDILTQGQHSVGFFSYYDDVHHKTVMFSHYNNAKLQSFPHSDPSFNAARISGVIAIFWGSIMTSIALLFVFFFSRPFSTMLGTFSIAWIIHTTMVDLLGISTLESIITVAALAFFCIVVSFLCKYWLSISCCLTFYAVMTAPMCVFQMLTFLAFNSNECNDNDENTILGGTGCSPIAYGSSLSVVAANLWLLGTSLLFFLSRYKNLVLDNPLKEQQETECAFNTSFDGLKPGEDTTCATTVVTYESTDSMNIGFDYEEDEIVAEV